MELSSDDMPKMMNRETNPVARYMWVPALAIVSLLALNLVRGNAFDPRGPVKGPGGREAVAAGAGSIDDNDPGLAQNQPQPSTTTKNEEARLGGVITSTANSEEAAKKVEKLRGQLKLSPEDYRLHYELGNALYDTGDRNGALTEYRKSIDINPKFVKAYVNLGETLREGGESKEAIETLEKALTIDQKDDVAHAALGFAYYSEKRYPDAINAFKRALAINPRSIHATYYMGMAFADAQIYREAIKWWDKVCEIDPNSDACLEARENNQLLRRIVN
jgi:tetratricopeptide (TPR) repeat protein